jgi:hypothetical protein
MEAKNLRTGNWVQDENEIIQYVYRIWQKGVELSEDENGSDDIDYYQNEIFGIPINELWLEKAEFKSGLIDDYKSLPIGNNTFLSSDGDAVWIDKVIDDKTYSVGLSGAKYVHELQNLFFALTGTELDIKP